MTTEQKLQIALESLQLIQEDASRPAHEVRQKMCEGLARKALERIARIGDSAQAQEAVEETVHEWFELTYAQFLTLPRVIMDAMPLDWQYKMTALLNQMDAQWNWLPTLGRQYYVRVGDSCWPSEDKDGNPIEPVLHEPDSDLCDYRHPRIEHRRKEPPAVVFPPINPDSHFN